MPYKYSFGVKLTNEGKKRLEEKLKAAGYKILEIGYDYVILETKVSYVKKENLIANLLDILIQEEVV